MEEIDYNFSSQITPNMWASTRSYGVFGLDSFWKIYYIFIDVLMYCKILPHTSDVLINSAQLSCSDPLSLGHDTHLLSRI